MPLALLPAFCQAQTVPAATVERLESTPALKPIEVQAFGRVQPVDGGGFRFQWPGVYFVATYHGSDFYFKVGPGDQNLHLWVDGHVLAPLVKPAPGEYRVHNVDDGNHAIRIDVVNENQDGPKTLGPFAIDPAGHSIAFTPGKRQIEFIGDSHTVGYGNTSPVHECSTDQIWATTDTSHSLGADIAMHYGANYQINAISGHGVVRNYNGYPGELVPVAYPFDLMDKRTPYNNPAWQPSVIVISLGTNDFSTPLNPGEPWKTRDALYADFEKTYVEFVQSLHKRDPKALIVLWATNMSNGEIASEVTKVVKRLHSAGDKRVDFVEVSGLSFTACNYHPSVADDAVIAGLIIGDIDKHHDVWPQP